MAAQPPKAAEESKVALHGRGGAGNINTKPAGPVAADDLQTPTLKSSMYTTGRGGSGNMASNQSAEEARKAQDIDTPKHHLNDPKGTYHWGRGGEGNMMTIGSNQGEKDQPKERTLSSSRRKTERSGSFQDAVKGMLGLKGKAEKPEKNESAIGD